MNTITGEKSINRSTVSFWDGFDAEIDIEKAKNISVSVKGVVYHNPLRFLEIYENSLKCLHVSKSMPQCFQLLNEPDSLKKYFMPTIPGVNFKIGENITQPPFTWKQCDAQTLLLNFSYNTSAIYRILSNLVVENKLAKSDIDSLLDHVCLLLSNIYQINNFHVIRNINNNLNMYFISKAIELVVGKEKYNSERQEFDTTQKALLVSIRTVREHLSLSVFDKIRYAVGKGVAFIEKGITEGRDLQSIIMKSSETSSRYCRAEFTIDHSRRLLDMIENKGLQKNRFNLVAILDDATETVDDFLWMQDLLMDYEFLTVHVLVNTAQISINFCSEMLTTVLKSPFFNRLVSELGTRFKVTTIFCPLISYQLNSMPSEARIIIDKADVIYIKGTNFFEACQIPNKPVFHAFVVSGPVSRKYTGLGESDAVFAFVPEGSYGYIHSRDPNSIVTLNDIVKFYEKRSF